MAIFALSNLKVYLVSNTNIGICLFMTVLLMLLRSLESFIFLQFKRTAFKIAVKDTGSPLLWMPCEFQFKLCFPGISEKAANTNKEILCIQF